MGRSSCQESGKMKFEELLSFCKKEIWVTDSAPAVPAYSYPWIIGFANTHKYFGFSFLNPVVVVYNKGWVEENTILSQRKKAFFNLYQKELGNPGFLASIMNSWAKTRDKALKSAETIENMEFKIGKDSLWRLYNDFLGAYIDVYSPPLICESADEISQEDVPEMLQKAYNIPAEEAKHLVVTMTTPSQMGFANRQRLSFIELCLAYDTGDYQNRLNEHTNNFHWILNNYKNVRILGTGFFHQKVLEEIKSKTQKQLIHEKKELLDFYDNIQNEKVKVNIKLKSEHVVLLQLLEQLANWHDERKYLSNRLLAPLCLLIKEISRRIPYNLEETEFLMPNEIKSALLDSLDMTKSTIKRRKECCVIVAEERPGLAIFQDDGAKNIVKSLNHMNKQDIKGFVAHGAGIVQGKVKIIFDPHKESIEPGEILVTTMTRPDFMPMLHKAKAIITDEGGVTCHASIISREMKIPCIVGTRAATKLLKTGDIVEVNCNQGTVKVIK
jgi:phosphohistidine swiveling domain-containing protein